MNYPQFSIGDPVEMTEEAQRMNLNHKSTTGVVVMHNPQTGTVTVLRKNERKSRIYLEKFWRKRVETPNQQA